MTPNPILKVLSTLEKQKVKCLLIGGQACIIYGAAEFSRDSDFILLCTPENLRSLQAALRVLKATRLYVPPLKQEYLERGHACHFRCNAKDVKGLRIDIISKLRGCEPFGKLWKRKKTVLLKNGNSIHVIGLRDLVQSKKTQRDKDWLMLKRLVENDYSLKKDKPSPERIKWWLWECRDVNILIELAGRYPAIAKECFAHRPLLSLAINKNIEKLDSALHEEELQERQKDIEYWALLRKELEMLRHSAKIGTK